MRSSGTIDKSNVTVYAVWAEDANGNEIPDFEETKYTLTFNGNGHTEGSAPTPMANQLSGLNVSLPGAGGMKRTEAVFLGWTANATQVLVTSAAEKTAANILPTNYTIGTSNVTLLAVWAEDINENGEPDFEETKYTLTYNGNGSRRRYSPDTASRAVR